MYYNDCHILDGKKYCIVSDVYYNDINSGNYVTLDIFLFLRALIIMLLFIGVITCFVIYIIKKIKK